MKYTPPHIIGTVFQRKSSKKIDEVDENEGHLCKNLNPYQVNAR